MNKSKWIKLIELLSIIIIPIVFIIFLIPQIVNTIKGYRSITYITTAKIIVVNAEKKYLENNLSNIDENITCDDVINLDEINYKSCSIFMNDNIAEVTLFGKGIYEGMNICSGTKDNITFVENCNGICIMNDFIEVETPYSVKDYDSCINYTKNLFINSREYTDEELHTFCKGEVVDGWTFVDNIEYMISKGYTERELVENNVIEGKINNICIPNEVHITCYEYDVYGEKGNWYAEITGYDDRCGNNIEIPERVDGILVKGIGDSAFHGTNVYSVKFPSTIKYIGNNAFRGLGEEELPNSNGVKINGTLDLSNMKNLESIGYFAFADNKIVEVKFPSSLKKIDGYAFSGNKITGELDLSLTKLTMIEEYVFSGSKISSIKFPQSITTIGYTAFAGNNISGVIDLSEYTNLTSIGGESFADNQITNILLPESINIIGNGAFSYNQIIGELDLSLYTNLKKISGFEQNLITNIKFPTSTTVIGKNAFSNNNITKLDLSDIVNLKEVSEFAFLNNKLTDIILPESIEIIKEGAFYKGKESNYELKKIINNSETTFNWHSITTEGEAEKCIFQSGICGDINITEK